MTTPPIPLRKEDLTVDWFNSVFQTNTTHDYSRISNIEVETIGTGIGLVGGLYRCSLTYEDDSVSGPTSVVAKIRGIDPNAVKVARQFQLYQKEVEFYRDIAPTTPVRVPFVHYSDFDRKTHDFVLVLEDLQYMRAFSQLDGGTPEQVMLAVERAAQFHARFWGKDGDSPLRDFHSLIAPGIAIKIHVGFRQCVDKVIDVFGDEISPACKQLIRDFGNNLAGYFRETSNQAKTLNHGDFRLDNMFFGDADSSDFALIDWQTCGIGIGLNDIAYFMSGSVDSEVRRKTERDAIAKYQEITSKQGHATWDFDSCWQEYRKSFVAAMTVPVIAAGTLSMEDQRAYELLLIGIRRMNATVEDLDVAEFSPVKRSIFSVPGMQSALGNQLARVIPTVAS